MKLDAKLSVVFYFIIFFKTLFESFRKAATEEKGRRIRPSEGGRWGVARLRQMVKQGGEGEREGEGARVAPEWE